MCELSRSTTQTGRSREVDKTGRVNQCWETTRPGLKGRIYHSPGQSEAGGPSAALG
jgi:hypothetical protein